MRLTGVAKYKHGRSWRWRAFRFCAEIGGRMAGYSLPRAVQDSTTERNRVSLSHKLSHIYWGWSMIIHNWLMVKMHNLNLITLIHPQFYILGHLVCSATSTDLQMMCRLRGTGEYDKVFADGIYNCAGCGTPLYKSSTKFNSGCGWPAFFEGLPGAINRSVSCWLFITIVVVVGFDWIFFNHESNNFQPDPDGRRTEITCAACGGHLGHVFKGEGFKTPTDERHCVNSVSVKFVPANSPPSLWRHVQLDNNVDTFGDNKMIIEMLIVSCRNILGL